jgi:ABC-2 type transport system permease protein
MIGPGTQRGSHRRDPDEDEREPASDVTSEGPLRVVDLPRVQEAPLAPPAPSGGLLEVFRRHYLLRLLVRKEVQARYQGSFLGVLWSYIQPLVRFLMYFLILGLILGLRRSVPNYALHIFCALTVVHFFTETFGGGTRSIVRNKALVQKMAMPREMFPVASVLVSAVNVVPQVLIVVIAASFSGWRPDVANIGAAVLSIAIVTVFGTALALLFSGMNVFFRDFQNIVATFTIFTRWIVPMIYPFSKVANALQDHTAVYYAYLSDPLAVAVILMQRAFWMPTFETSDQMGYPDVPHHLWLLGLLALAASFVCLGVCQFAFTKMENKIAERV